ncbi:hypothetical protein FVE85_0436 [Porphyridium purpureum]|uniref:Right handed beta helix domain-containing protein n=1 Tax=Porphyridium purpureum TaxID=35688 RepID=A0A5J4Z1Z5_PORPP|nr:hypothetical protein FVE85_0436 [Porphyridium purpureum]|eukprot:POR4340..scf208_2
MQSESREMMAADRDEETVALLPEPETDRVRDDHRPTCRFERLRTIRNGAYVVGVLVLLAVVGGGVRYSKVPERQGAIAKWSRNNELAKWRRPNGIYVIPDFTAVSVESLQLHGEQRVLMGCDASIKVSSSVRIHGNVVFESLARAERIALSPGDCQTWNGIKAVAASVEISGASVRHVGASFAALTVIDAVQVNVRNSSLTFCEQDGLVVQDSDNVHISNSTFSDIVGIAVKLVYYGGTNHATAQIERCSIGPVHENDFSAIYVQVAPLLTPLLVIRNNTIRTHGTRGISVIQHVELEGALPALQNHALVDISYNHISHCRRGALRIFNLAGRIAFNVIEHNYLDTAKKLQWWGLLQTLSENMQGICVAGGLSLESNLMRVYANEFMNNTVLVSRRKDKALALPAHLCTRTMPNMRITPYFGSRYHHITGYFVDGIEVHHNRFISQASTKAKSDGSGDFVWAAVAIMSGNVTFQYNHLFLSSLCTATQSSIRGVLDCRYNYWGGHDPFAIGICGMSISDPELKAQQESSRQRVMTLPVLLSKEPVNAEVRFFELKDDTESSAMGAYVPRAHAKGDSTILMDLSRASHSTVYGMNQAALDEDRPSRYRSLLKRLRPKSERPISKSPESWSIVRMGGFLLTLEYPGLLPTSRSAPSQTLMIEIRRVLFRVVYTRAVLKSLRKARKKLSAFDVVVSAWKIPYDYVSIWDRQFIEPSLVRHAALYFAVSLHIMHENGANVEFVEALNEPDGRWGTVIPPASMGAFLIYLHDAMRFLMGRKDERDQSNSAMYQGVPKILAPGSSQMVTQDRGFQGLSAKNYIEALDSQQPKLPHLLMSPSHDIKRASEVIFGLSFHSWDDVYLAWEQEQVFDLALQRVRKLLASTASLSAKPMFITEWGLKSPMLLVSDAVGCREQQRQRGYWMRLYSVSPEFGDGGCDERTPWSPAYPTCASYPANGASVPELVESQELSPLIVPRYMSRMLLMINHKVDVALFWELADAEHAKSGWGMFDRMDHMKPFGFVFKAFTDRIPKGSLNIDRTWNDSAAVLAAITVERRDTVVLAVANPTPFDLDRQIVMDHASWRWIEIVSYVAAETLVTDTQGNGSHSVRLVGQLCYSGWQSISASRDATRTVTSGKSTVVQWLSSQHELHLRVPGFSVTIVRLSAAKRPPRAERKTCTRVVDAALLANPNLRVTHIPQLGGC